MPYQLYDSETGTYYNFKDCSTAFIVRTCFPDTQLANRLKIHAAQIEAQLKDERAKAAQLAEQKRIKDAQLAEQKRIKDAQLAEENRVKATQLAEQKRIKDAQDKENKRTDSILRNVGLSTTTTNRTLVRKVEKKSRAINAYFEEAHKVRPRSWSIFRDNWVYNLIVDMETKWNNLDMFDKMRISMATYKDLDAYLYDFCAALRKKKLTICQKIHIEFVKVVSDCDQLEKAYE